MTEAAVRADSGRLHHGDAERREEAIRRALDEIVLSGLPPISLGLGAMYALLGAVHLKLLPAVMGSFMGAVAVTTAAALLGLWLLLARVKVPHHLAHPLAACVGGGVLLNSLLHVYFTVEPIHTTGLILLTLGAAILFLDAGWFAVLVTATFSGWFLVVRSAPPSPDWIRFGFYLLGAALLSSAVIAIRIRTFRRLEELSFRERLRQLELQAGLARTEAARRGEQEARRALESAVTELRESEERFRRLAEATFEGLLIQQDGAVVDANPRAAELFGYAPSDVLRLTFLELVAPGSRDDVRRFLEEASDGRREEELLEAEGLRRDASRFPLELVVTRAMHRGRPALVTVVRDVTSHKRVEEILRRAADVAEANSLAKSVFLANMGHELRTPLTAVIGFANVLLKNRAGKLGSQELEYLRRVVANGEHLLYLLADVLDLSKIEAGWMEIAAEAVELDPLIQGTLETLEPQARWRNVELRGEIPTGLRPVEADRQRLQQVLASLVGNAIKFTPEGRVTVRVIADPDTGTPLRIEVEDTGIGIPQARIPHIFTAFQQAKRMRHEHQGSGLGLTIARSLCELMGFGLGVESEEGKGSTFTISLAESASFVAGPGRRPVRA